MFSSYLNFSVPFSVSNELERGRGQFITVFSDAGNGSGRLQQDVERRKEDTVSFCETDELNSRHSGLEKRLCAKVTRIRN